MASNAMEPDCRGWQVGQTLTQCLQHMLDNEVSCDVTFLVTSDTSTSRISAHKFMLRARSPVFEAMFSGNFAESMEDVTIVDIDPDIMKIFFRYLYTDKVALSGENVLHLLYVAKKYIVEGLEAKCNTFLEKKISEENVCSILSDSLRYSDERLVDTCLDYIAGKVDIVSKTNAFYTMSHNALLEIVKSEKLNVKSEMNLFKGCLEWAKRRAVTFADDEIRTRLGQCLFEIRFPSLPPNEFAKLTEESHVLTSEEKSHILYWFMTKNNVHTAALKQLGFSTTSRRMVYQRYRHSDDGITVTIVPNTSKEVFHFSVNRAIILTGFSITLGSHKTKSSYNVNISVEDIANGATILKCNDTCDAIPNSRKFIPIRVTRTVLRPRQQYCVTTSITGEMFTSVVLSRVPPRVGEVNFSEEVITWPAEHHFRCTYITEIQFVQSY